MGVRKFKVEFENPSRCFFPGQLVRGRVIFDIKKKKEIKGICVKFEGKATVSWSEKGLETNGSDQKKSLKVIYYRDIESYFNVELTLAGHPNSQDSSRKSSGVTVAVGRTIYPFVFTLPSGIPSSYAGKAGQVYYSVEVIVHYGKADLKQRFPFTVNGILDLNFDSGTMQSQEFRKYKSLCCLCCRSGPVGFLLKLPKKGYVPGEPIHFVLEVNNQSTRKINAITMSLVQLVSFHAKGNTSIDTRTIRKIRGPEVSKGEVELWDRDALKIPPVPPTKLCGCRIIDLQYLIKVEMEISGVTKNLVGELPIVIGTIPLRSTFPQVIHAQPPPPVPQLSIQNSQSFIAGVQEEYLLEATRPSAPIFDNYPDLPPPTYEEAMGSPEDCSSKGEVNAAFKSAQSDNTTDLTADKLRDLYQVDSTFSPLYITYRFAD